MILTTQRTKFVRTRNFDTMKNIFICVLIAIGLNGFSQELRHDNMDIVQRLLSNDDRIGLSELEVELAQINPDGKKSVVIDLLSRLNKGTNEILLFKDPENSISGLDMRKKDERIIWAIEKVIGAKIEKETLRKGLLEDSAKRTELTYYALNKLWENRLALARKEIASKSKNEKLDLARSTDAPAEILFVLASDSEDGIRIAVAENESTPGYTLQILLSDPNEEIKKIAISRMVSARTLGEKLRDQQSQN